MSTEKRTNSFQLTVTVETDRDAKSIVEMFQKFFDYYHPSLKAKVAPKAESVSAPVVIDDCEDLL